MILGSQIRHYKVDYVTNLGHLGDFEVEAESIEEATELARKRLLIFKNSQFKVKEIILT